LLLLLLLLLNGSRIAPIRGGSLRCTLAHNGLQRNNVGILGGVIMGLKVRGEGLNYKCEKMNALDL
jgi:hypothetical protein